MLEHHKKSMETLEKWPEMDKVTYFSDEPRDDQKFFVKNKNGFIFRVKYSV